MAKSFRDQIADNMYYDEKNEHLYCYYYCTMFLIAEGADFSYTILGAFTEKANWLKTEAIKRFNTLKEAEELRDLKVDHAFRDYIVTRQLGDYLYF